MSFNNLKLKYYQVRNGFGWGWNIYFVTAPWSLENYQFFNLMVAQNMTIFEISRQ